MAIPTSRTRGTRSLGLLCVLTVVLALGACGGGDEDAGDAGPGNVTVFEASGKVQCQPRPLTPEQSAMKLVNGGVDVVRSGCGVITGGAYATVCGGSTGDILLHDIRRENLGDAQRLGFADVATLRKSGDQGYLRQDCSIGNQGP